MVLTVDKVFFPWGYGEDFTFLDEPHLAPHLHFPDRDFLQKVQSYWTPKSHIGKIRKVQSPWRPGFQTGIFFGKSKVFGEGFQTGIF